MSIIYKRESINEASAVLADLYMRRDGMELAPACDKAIIDVDKALHRCFNGKNGDVNGHFWVERDGVIIDTSCATKGNQESLATNKRNIMIYGVKFGKTKKQMKEMVDNAELVYKECPNPITQQLMIRCVNKDAIVGFEGIPEETAREIMKCIEFVPEYGCCNCNAWMEQNKNGGVIKFGSVGMKYPNGTLWQYGDENFATIKDYRKDNMEVGYAEKLLEMLTK